MKTIIAGSRSITDPAIVYRAIRESRFRITHVISGTAAGVDIIGECWAEEIGIPVTRMPADWDNLDAPGAVVRKRRDGKLYNAAAGKDRNRDMAHAGDALICVWDGVSGGSAYMWRYMRSLHRLVYLWNTKNDAGEIVGVPGFAVGLARGTIGKCDGIDITVKSATGQAAFFAPDWGMVRGHQSHLLSNEEYSRKYVAILDAVPIAGWRWLTSQMKGGIITVLCYCEEQTVDGAPKFCHTHLLIEYMLRRWPSFFRDARGI
jgi:hypothetical protein